MSFDVAIIGAGPAGAVLARMLGNSHKVLLIEKKQLPSAPQDTPGAKCCGGLLGPDAQQALAKLGLALPENVLTGPQLFTVRTIDLQTRRERFYQRHYLNLDRGELERWLLSLIPPAVDIRPGCRFKSCQRESGGVKLSFAKGKKTYTERAEILVGADGAASRVRKLVFPGRSSPKVYLAIQEWACSPELLPYFVGIFDREITDFYSWIIPKGDFLIIGSALISGEGTVAKFELLKKKLAEFGFRFGKTIKKERGLLFRPVKTSQVFLGHDDIALVGEAAGWISPSSAEGLSYAFNSAAGLAAALGQGAHKFLKRYAKNTRDLKQSISRKNLKSHFIHNPWLRRLVMRSGMGSMRVSE